MTPAPHAARSSRRPPRRWLLLAPGVALAALAAVGLTRAGAPADAVVGAGPDAAAAASAPTPSEPAAPDSAPTPAAEPTASATESTPAAGAAPVAAPEPPPAPPPPAPTVRSAARPDLDVTTVLGPPPGPRQDPRPTATAAPADRFALLVGVQDYREPTKDTIASARDAHLVRERLVAAGWLPQNVRVLTDAAATGASVREGLAWLTARSRPGTFALFHYSGHVKQLGGTTEALWPADRGFVRDTELTAALSGAQGRLWVDIAGCEAGSFLPGLPSARTLFSGSSKGTEKSYEQPDWDASVWTGLLFDQGLGRGHADADRDGRTTVGEALRWAQWAAQGVTFGQRPHGQQTPQFAGAPDLGWTLADPPA